MADSKSTAISRCRITDYHRVTTSSHVQNELHRRVVDENNMPVAASSHYVQQPSVAPEMHRIQTPRSPATTIRTLSVIILGDQGSLARVENLSHRFLDPNVLDIKLGAGRGFVMMGEAKQKTARMINKAKEATSFETGVRLTGFRLANMHQLSFNRSRSIVSVRFLFGCRLMKRRPVKRSTLPGRMVNKSKLRICQTALPDSPQFIHSEQPAQRLPEEQL